MSEHMSTLGGPQAPKQGKPRAGGGARTAFQHLQAPGSPGNMRSPARSDTGTTRSEDQGADVVHTSFFATPGGWRIGEILGHGVINCHPTPGRSASVTADHMLEWFDAGAVDGFWVSTLQTSFPGPLAPYQGSLDR